MMVIARKRKKIKLGTVILYTVLIVSSITCLYPLIWLILNSFKTNSQLFNDPWGITFSPVFGNYITAWTSGKIGTSFLNSVFVSASSMLITIIIASMAAFAITRLKWKLSGAVLDFFLLGVMIPIHSTLIPLFLMFNKIKLTNNYLSLILPYVAFALPTSIFILTGFMSTIPREVEEAFIIDGGSMAGVFWKIIFPLSKSPIATISIFNFVSMWNELMFALIFMSDQNKMTLPVCLTRFKGQYSTNWTVQLAAVVIMVIPSIAVYLLLSDRIIESMTVGAVKG
ncbi:putative ABC transporter permease protein ORF2 [Thermoclostridium stercorarium subsp. stercorarium DSM 8532]|jgi:raffinose/stachyose/melibiose transport system permease protein|uniref:ABC transporter permease n=3 Tax=Thermoclostridium stercorarium TaxID=1510 RepID=A0A1B1YLC9_THEST|nr:carbohydrate ABC transporter permease [Thermoclostridium stercorarium]AGC68682.1 putative ABC transporter permease protein ORF2 [Thermoclostridium stercorarium subsp. stercorarium DSM 8532]AGI39692.1 ABC transporter periplasmic subunit-2 [Thermoclostridium stercorarium subsp. stercorarium DSM 8532]ANW99018.1 ABC transporter permease [Thermoclostridium stercorarium subsp. thermolacticum DSM 2910]ANX01546.1 ABC transporter permease [Thermoclostridium stercorarium subsp. leptospartum DSM 9219]